MKKVLVVLTVFIFLLISAYALSSKVDTQESLSKIEYKKVNVLKGDLIVKVSAKGIVQPNFKVDGH